MADNDQEPRPEGNELWAWQVQEPDGRWSMCGMSTIGSGVMPMIHRDYAFVTKELRQYAVMHAQASKQPLRLAHFTLEMYRMEEV